MAKTTPGALTAEEKAAVKAYAKEKKALASKVDGEAMVVAAIAELPDVDRALAERLHEIIKAAAPTLLPRTWYGQPAYATEAGRIICFFQPSSKFKTRYTSLGFGNDAKLDDGEMWPVGFAVVALTPDVEARIAELVARAAG